MSQAHSSSKELSTPASSKQGSNEHVGSASSISSLAREQGPLRAAGPAVGLGVGDREMKAQRSIQPKLTVNDPDDKYEREADRVADAVMRMSDPESTFDSAQNGPSDHIQGMCPRCRRRSREGEPLNCEECEQDLKRSADEGGVSVTQGEVEQAAAVTDEPGRPLPDRVKSFFESRMGMDFSGVRIHTGPKADRAARSVNAKAYTLGSDVVFRSGPYRPTTQDGKRLLAHELTHVLQQGGIDRAGGRRPSGGAAGLVQRDGPSEEQQSYTKETRQLCMQQGEDILPPRVGLVTDIHRTVTLREHFGDRWSEIKAAIRADREARALVCDAGVPGVIALVDSQEFTGNMDVSVARELLRDHPEDYTHEALRNPLRRRRELAGERLEQTRAWASSTVRQDPHTPGITAILGLPSSERDRVRAILRILEPTQGMYARLPGMLDRISERLDTVLAKIADARDNTSSVHRAPAALPELRMALDEMEETVPAIGRIHSWIDMGSLREDAIDLAQGIDSTAGDISSRMDRDRVYELRDSLSDLRDSARDLKKRVRDRRQEVSGGAEAVERIRFVLRYFLQMNDRGFDEPPSAEEIERFRAHSGTFADDMELVFGSGPMVSQGLLPALEAQFRRQLEVLAAMEEATGQRPAQVPALGEARDYFQALQNRDNDQVREAYTAFARAFFVHRVVRTAADLEESGLGDIFERDVSIAGRRRLVCTGYAVLGAGLFALAGGEATRFIIGIRATQQELAEGEEFSDAHALARIRRNGEVFFVSNYLTVDTRAEGIGPDAVAWENPQGELIIGAGTTLDQARNDAVQKLQDRQQEVGGD